MSFSDEIVKTISTRSTFIRINPSRYISESLTLVSGSTYQMNFPYVISGIKRNGNSLTLVSSLSGNDQYTYNEETKVLQVRLASAPNSTTNVVILNYFIFYSSSGPEGVIANQTPGDTGTPKRFWEPRISSAPSIDESLSDIFYGTFTVSPSSVDLINTDSDFEKYLTENDSFRNSELKTWVNVNDEFLEFPTFKVANINVGNTVTIDTVDVFYNLTQKAYMGDSASESIFFKSAGSYPNVNPADAFKPVPFIFGKTVAEVTATGGWSNGKMTLGRFLGAGVTEYNAFYMLSKDSTVNLKAVCTNFNGSPASNANREWTLCRTNGDFKTLNFGTPIGSILKVYSSGSSIAVNDWAFSETSGDGSEFVRRPAWVMDYSGTPNGNLEVGDSFSDDNVTPTYFVVLDVGSNYVRGYVANLAVGSPGGDPGYNQPVSGLLTNQSPCIVINEKLTNRVHFAVHGLDFTTSITTTTGGNKLMKITFLNNFESQSSITIVGFGSFSNHPGLSNNYIAPETHDIFFRVSQDQAYSRHDTVLKHILEKSGLVCDTTTFAAAGSALTSNCVFHVPNLGETEIDSYLKYAQDILRSTFGFVKYNPLSSDVEYYLVNSLSPTSNDDDSLFLEKKPTVEIDYFDIATEIIANNRHIFGTKGESPSDAVVSSNKARYLHNVDQKRYLTHVLDTMGSRLQKILDVTSNRKANYRYSIASSKLASSVGDDVEITSVDGIIGGLDSISSKIIRIRKSEDIVEVTTNDLLGV